MDAEEVGVEEEEDRDFNILAVGWKGGLSKEVGMGARDTLHDHSVVYYCRRSVDGNCNIVHCLMV